MNTINKTLLDNLFLNIKYATPQKEIYSFVKGRIFPNSDDYIQFLELSDVNEKRELAKKILKRLCMFSNYQPPYEIIINISQQEKSNKNQSIDDKYIPQDHFVHIVNTYIFGVYLFFEHPSLSRELNLLFSDKREGDNYLRKINAVNDFISSWKSFCLYHDIGYPFEIYYDKDKILCDDELNAMDIFNKIYDHLKKQLSIKALAKLIVINSMLNEAKKNRDSRNVSSTLSYKFISVIGNGTQLHGENMEFVNNYYELEDIYTYEHFKMFLGFMDQNDVMKVLFDRVLGYPVAFSYTDQDNEYVYKNEEVALMMSEDDLTFFFSRDDMSYDEKIKSNYELKYYIKNPIISFEQSLPNNKITREDLDNILELVKEENIYFDFKHVNCEYDLDNLVFEAYEALTKLLEICLSSFKEKEKEELTTCRFNKIIFANRDAVYQDYIKEKMLEEIKKYLSADHAKYEKQMKNLKNKLLETEPVKSNFSEHILEYIKNIFSTDGLEKITENIVDQMINTLQDEIYKRNSFVRSYAIISHIIDLNCEEIKADNFITNDKFNIQLLIDSAMKNKRIEDEYEEIQGNMLEKKYVSIEDLITKYVNFTKYDHGICSSVIYLYINSVSAFFAEKINNNETDKFTKMLIPLFWAINPKLLPQKLLTNYKHIHEEVFHAIFCHNIYAETANEIFKLNKEKIWTTKIDKEAFLYFCMLCDSLQHWEREKYYDPRRIDYTPLFAMDLYNISIKNDKITITTVADPNNYENILKEFKYDDFLEDCSKYLSLEIRSK